MGTRGLTMLLVPLDSPGIEIQPVHTMGHERTNVVFYNDVRVADANRIGEAHEGFSVMRAALEAEQNVAPASRTTLVAADTLEFARTQPGPDGAPLINDDLVRERLARMAMEGEVADLLGLRAAFLDAEGEKPGPVSALFGPESYVRSAAAASDIAGVAGLLDWTDPEAPWTAAWTRTIAARSRQRSMAAPARCCAALSWRTGWDSRVAAHGVDRELKEIAAAVDVEVGAGHEGGSREAQNAMTAATSCGSPSRPRSTDCRDRAPAPRRHPPGRPSRSRCASIGRAQSVRIGPGATALTGWRRPRVAGEVFGHAE